MLAVDNFRLLHGVTEPLRLVKENDPLVGWVHSASKIEAVFWRKQL
jgi:hypothetical protein